MSLLAKLGSWPLVMGPLVENEVELSCAVFVAEEAAGKVYRMNPVWLPAVISILTPLSSTVVKRPTVAVSWLKLRFVA